MNLLQAPSIWCRLGCHHVAIMSRSKDELVRATCLLDVFCLLDYRVVAAYSDDHLEAKIPAATPKLISDRQE